MYNKIVCKFNIGLQEIILENWNTSEKDLIEKMQRILK